MWGEALSAADQVLRGQTVRPHITLQITPIQVSNDENVWSIILSYLDWPALVGIMRTRSGSTSLAKHVQPRAGWWVAHGQEV